MSEAERRAAADVRRAQEAYKEAAAHLKRAREAADGVLADAEALSASLKEAAGRLTAAADRLVQDVQLTHRELLAEMRVPGIADREQARAANEERQSRTGGIFEVPEWGG
jgi:hypothetical protein